MARPAVFSSHSYTEALAIAEREGKLLIVDATAAWCGPCKMMDRTTWSDAAVAEWIGEHAIAIQIDVDEQEELAGELRIRAMPTVIAFADGGERDRTVGAKDPRALIAWLDGVVRGETTIDQLRAHCEAHPSDMQARYELARALLENERLDEATDELVWLWEHVLEHEPEMVGVRGSYMLQTIATLIGMHPAARERFAALRDAHGREVRAGARGRELTDWIDLGQALGDDDPVISWLEPGKEELEPVVVDRLLPLLFARDRWADAGRIVRDPKARFDQTVQRLEEFRRVELPEGMEDERAEIEEFFEKQLVEDTATMIGALLAAGRNDEAREVEAELVRVRPGHESIEAIAEAKTKAGVG